MPPAASQGSQTDDSYAILWWIAAFFALLLAIWYFYQNQLMHAYVYVKYFELKFLQIFSSTHFNALSERANGMLSSKTPLKPWDVVDLGQAVGRYFRIPFFILLIGLSILVYIGNSTRLFKRIYSMRELAELEQYNWPQITPIIGLDLVKENIDRGPWAMAMTPVQFCKKHKLLEEHRTMVRGARREQVDVVLKKGEANKVFSLQLGALWQGVDALSLHTAALFAAFAARIHADSKLASQLLMEISASSKATLNFGNVKPLLVKYADSKIIKQITESHAYVFTVMCSMLEAARLDGVQASADFLWLKPMDRRLWYTLNMVGRQTPFPEVAGIFAHWIAEKEAGRKLWVPMVEEATKAVEIALKEIIYRPDEAE